MQVPYNIENHPMEKVENQEEPRLDEELNTLIYVSILPPVF